MKTLSPTDYYQNTSAPYYIMAPDFTEKSSGIRVLHFLCHTLNSLGYEAYVTANVTDGKLWTPQLSEDLQFRHFVAGRKPIVIYPEIIRGAPLGLGLKVRYLLNKAGFIAGHTEFDDEEILVAYREQFIGDSGARELLFLPACDLTRFNLEGVDDTARSGRYFYFNRYLERGGKLMADTVDAIEISPHEPRTLDQLAAIFKKAELLYCYEDSAISVEARLCGCPVVYLPNETMLPAYPEDAYSRAGAAWGNSPEEIERARQTVGEVATLYRDLYRNLDAQLQRFVELTQSAARALPPENCYPPATLARRGWLSSTGDHRLKGGDQNAHALQAYTLWRKRRTLQEIDGQILAERMLSQWRYRPRFAIGITLAEGESELLANSIDSMARQWYAEWQLAIFAPGVEAPEALHGIDQISWISNPELKAGFASLRELRDADFYAVLPAGTQLEDHALQVVADEVNASAQWLAVYTDHDETGVEHAGAEPRFKSDFNPELLYSTDYIGPAAFICREALDAFAGSDEIDAASPFGVLLRIFEQTGGNTIGHLPDPLIHCPQVARHTEFEEQALARSFERRGLSASIESGWFTHTRRVRFECPPDCAVSVIVLTHSQPGYLRRCIESLLRTAAAPVLEIVAVAHRVSDGDLIALLDELQAGAFGVPGTVLSEAGEFEPGKFRNRAAQQARGDFLLFVDDDTEYFQEGWLAAMLGHARAADLAAVGPRLVSSTDGPPRIVGGGQILGLKGLASNLAEGSPSMFDARCDFRLVLDQAISALPGTCLLVDRQHFEALGGFDAEAAPLHLHDLDFCIRALRSGRRLAWLASVDVAHQEGITVRDTTQTSTTRVRWFADAEGERARLLERHIEFIAADPNYNRNLSLREPYAIDIEAVADWNPRFHDRPRFLGVPLTTGAGEYRLVAPFKALAKAGLAQCTIVHPVAENTLRALMAAEVARLAPDTVVIQNCIEDSMINQFAESARFNPDIDHIATIDDRLGDLPRDNPLYPIHARQGRTKVRRGLSHCRRLIVTTEPLKHYFGDLIDDIRVVPNRLEREVWGRLRGKPNDTARPRIGWVGAMQHAGDLKLIEPIVRELAQEVDWVLMGMCPDFLKPFVKEVHEFVSIQDYPRKMASLALDLALAPLEVHPFNECKSNLRLLEYGALGWPVVCTDIDPYRTGTPPVLRLPNHPAAWVVAIRERLADPAALRGEGERLRDWVQANYMLEDGLESWLQALSGK